MWCGITSFFCMEWLKPVLSILKFKLCPIICKFSLYILIWRTCLNIEYRNSLPVNFCVNVTNNCSHGYFSCFSWFAPCIVFESCRDRYGISHFRFCGFCFGPPTFVFLFSVNCIYNVAYNTGCSAHLVRIATYIVMQ